MAEANNLDECVQSYENNENVLSNEFIPSDIREKYMEHAFLEYVHQMVQRFRQRELENDTENTADNQPNAEDEDNGIGERRNLHNEINSIENEINIPTMRSGVVSNVEENDEYQEISSLNINEAQDLNEMSEDFEVARPN